MEAVEEQFTPLLLDFGHHQQDPSRGGYTGGDDLTIGELVFELDFNIVRGPHWQKPITRVRGLITVRCRSGRAALPRIGIVDRSATSGFTPIPGLSHAVAARLTQVDYDREMAEHDGSLLGAARKRPDTGNVPGARLHPDPLEDRTLVVGGKAARDHRRR
jgi:hypothetical protein